MTREVAELSEQLAVIAKKQDVLFDLQRQLSNAKNLEQFVKSLENYTPAPGSQCKDLVQLVSDIAAERRKTLQALLSQPELAPKAAQIQGQNFARIGGGKGNLALARAGVAKGPSVPVALGAGSLPLQASRPSVATCRLATVC